MKLTKKAYSIFAVALLWMVVLTGNAVAACGDSFCFWAGGIVGGQFVCIVEGPGGPQVCTPTNPCDISCNPPPPSDQA